MLLREGAEREREWERVCVSAHVSWNSYNEAEHNIMMIIRLVQL